jgi:hypothetical protein
MEADQKQLLNQASARSIAPIKFSNSIVWMGKRASGKKRIKVRPEN